MILGLSSRPCQAQRLLEGAVDDFGGVVRFVHEPCRPSSASAQLGVVVVADLFVDSRRNHLLDHVDRVSVVDRASLLDRHQDWNAHSESDHGIGMADQSVDVDEARRLSEVRLLGYEDRPTRGLGSNSAQFLHELFEGRGEIACLDGFRQRDSPAEFPRLEGIVLGQRVRIPVPTDPQVPQPHLLGDELRCEVAAVGLDLAPTNTVEGLATVHS